MQIYVWYSMSVSVPPGASKNPLGWMHLVDDGPRSFLINSIQSAPDSSITPGQVRHWRPYAALSDIDAIEKHSRGFKIVWQHLWKHINYPRIWMIAPSGPGAFSKSIRNALQPSYLSWNWEANPQKVPRACRQSPRQVIIDNLMPLKLPDGRFVF